MIHVRQISKCYRIYRRPSDHLKEILSFGRKRFHEPFWALQSVDVDVPNGCCLGIIGENGSGKSTLLRIIAGVVRPTSGEIEVKGRVAALLELGAGFNPEFTGRENVLLNASILGFTDVQTRELMPSIEEFAEIGEFVDRPVKTYSSGMFVRLAFAVAIHMNPDVLVIDEALSVGDFFFQQRCIRRILEMKQRGVTIVFVSHDIEAIRSIADRAIWMDHGRVHREGDPRDVTGEYVATLLSRGKKEASPEEAAANVSPLAAELYISEEALARIPALLDHLPNVDQRHGNGKARILGIGVFSHDGSLLTRVEHGNRICVRISVEFFEDTEHPNVGFMFRNRLGQDVTASNLMFEGEKIGRVRAGERLSVDFILDLPLLQGGFYHLSPAVANGTLDQYVICDWIDNAYAFEVVQRVTTFGHMRIPMRVRAMTVPPEPSRVR